MDARPNTLTIAFYVTFALWFTATRYGPPGIYSWVLAPSVVSVLSLGPIVLFSIVAILAARRAVRAASFPWLDVAVVAGGIVGSDLFWRLYLSPHAWDAFKLTSIAFDIATPLIVALGVAAVIGKVRRPAKTVTI
jgi:hypothetical protein